MDRFPDSEVDPDGRIPYWQNYFLEGQTVRHEDDDLPPEDRSDRLVNPELDEAHRVVAYGTTLQVGDDVICGGLPLRVFGPCRHHHFFWAYYAPWFGDMPIQMSAEWISEIARADPAYDETPLWLEPEPPTEEPPPEPTPEPEEQP